MMLIWILLVGGGLQLVSTLSCIYFLLGVTVDSCKSVINLSYKYIRFHPSILYTVTGRPSLHTCEGGIGLVSNCLCGIFCTRVHTVTMGPLLLASVDALAWLCTLISSTVSPPFVGVVAALLSSVSPIYDASVPMSSFPSIWSSSVEITSSVGLVTLNVVLPLPTSVCGPEFS